MFGRSRTDLKVWRVFFEASRACGGNTRSAASAAWSLSRVCQCVEGITSTSSKRGWQSSRQRARRTRSDLECFFFRAVSRWLGWTSRGTMTQITRETVKVAGHLLQWWSRSPRPAMCAAPAPFVGCIGFVVAVPYVSAAQACMLHLSQSLGMCRTTAPEKLGAQPAKCKPGALVLVYPAICDRDAWRRPDHDRQRSPRRGEGGHNFWCPAVVLLCWLPNSSETDGRQQELSHDKVHRSTQQKHHGRLATEWHLQIYVEIK